MGAMSSPDSTLRRDRVGLQMTNSQSVVVNSCFRLRRHCSRYRHSDNRAAKSALPVIPVSPRLHQEVQNRVAEQQQCKKKEEEEKSSVIPMTASLCVFFCLALSLHPSTFSVTGARSLPTSRSSCPCSLTVSSLTVG